MDSRMILNSSYKLGYDSRSKRTFKGLDKEKSWRNEKCSDEGDEELVTKFTSVNWRAKSDQDNNNTKVDSENSLELSDGFYFFKFSTHDKNKEYRKKDSYKRKSWNCNGDYDTSYSRRSKDNFDFKYDMSRSLTSYSSSEKKHGYKDNVVHESNDNCHGFQSNLVRSNSFKDLFQNQNPVSKVKHKKVRHQTLTFGVSAEELALAKGHNQLFCYQDYFDQLPMVKSGSNTGFVSFRGGIGGFDSEMSAKVLVSFQIFWFICYKKHNHAKAVCKIELEAKKSFHVKKMFL